MIESLKFLTKAGLSRKIVTLLLVSSIIPLSILTAIYFTFYFQGQKQRVIDVQQEIGKVVSTNISAYLKKILGQIQFSAATSVPNMKNNKELVTLSDIFLNQMPDLDEITFMDLEGNEICKVSRYYSFRPFELKNVASDRSFQLARNGEIHVGPLELSPFSRFPIVRMVVPILDLKDHVIGVLVAGATIQKMWDFISRYQIGENRYAYVVDSKGVLIAYEDLSSVLQKMDLTMIPGVSHFVSGKIGVFEYKGLTGQEVIGAVSVIPLTGWGVIVEEPTSAAFKDLRLLSSVFLGIFFVTILLAVFLGFRFSYSSILKPVDLLEQEVEAISTGNFDRSIRFDASNELGRLAENINRMAERLKTTTVSRDLLIEEIAERKKAEAALQKSEATLKGIFQAAPIGIGVVTDRTMKWVNDKMCEISGYDSGELIDQSARVLYPTQDEFERVGKIKNDQLASKGTGSVETQWRKKGGEIIDILANWARLDRSDASIGDIFAVLDITGKKQAEEEKEKLETRLRQAQKMEAIGTLAGGIAHDFNNILGIILGNSELAVNDVPKSHPARRNLEEIRTASLRAKDMVRHLLSFARKSEPAQQIIHLIPIVKETVKLLRSSIPASIEIRQDMPLILDTILGDPTQIHQILINLASNASHAMPDGGLLEIGVRIETVHETVSGPYSDLDPGNYVLLTVSDTGEGIDPNIKDRIFDPYFTTKDIGKGTGMGLAVVHGIVKSHSGRIFVDSKPGNGTLFSIFFPQAEGEAAPEVETRDPYPTGRERILIVDDEPSVLDIGTAILNRLGYHVESETNPIAALKLFGSKPDFFDLVITDMTMPQMTGDHLSQQIRSIRDNIPIIICTGFSERISEESAGGMGIQGYLEKPLDLRVFAATIRRVLDKGTFLKS
ncbi:MAG: hypothetical protein A2V65_06680 [Deltaproteobacteria bacterium RBG_13_49_15]|nr:MAG: hypothetical protein A2V65_06680 [Deltaproteobacteria bacterium RBG_13_49_15]